MSTYLRMWDEVRDMTLEEVNRLLAEHTPTKGVVVQLKTVKVIDVDLVEALRHHKSDLYPKRRRNATKPNTPR